MDDIEQLLTDFNRVKAACQEMEQKKILVGLISDKVDSDVMIIAHAHEYGVPGKLPERSFIRKSFDTGQDQDAGEANQPRRCRKLHRGAGHPTGPELH